jgi:tRNA threonylcarbamoyladenosine biosynthesis protein TsaE
MEFYCSTIKDLENPARKLKELADYKDSPIILLNGSMGSGKTTFTRVFVHLYNKTIHVSSPTYNIVNVYPISNDFHIHHLDLYRVTSESDIHSVGLEEIFENHGLTIIEWPEKSFHLFPREYFSIDIQVLSYDRRKVTIESKYLEDKTSMGLGTNH